MKRRALLIASTIAPFAAHAQFFSERVRRVAVLMGYSSEDEQAQARFLQQTGDPATAQQLAWQALENLRQQQASALSYFDVFWLSAVVMLALTLVVFFMKRSVAEKGAPIGGE